MSGIHRILLSGAIVLTAVSAFAQEHQHGQAPQPAASAEHQHEHGAATSPVAPGDGSGTAWLPANNEM